MTKKPQIDWKNVPFIDYMNACDDYASTRYAIDSSDLGIDEKMMADAQEALGSPAELYKRSGIDIHTILKARGQIAMVWSIEDVQSRHPDLNDEQAWLVLQQCQKWHDCNEGFTWQLIETVAEMLYPEQT